MSPRVPLAALFGLGVISCDPEPNTTVRQQPKAQPKAGALAQARASVTKHMGSHFARAKDMEAGLIAGDLRRVTAAARTLEEHRPQAYPEPWMPFIMGLRGAAAGAARAKSLDVAAARVAEVAKSCGSCHRALGGGPKFVPQPQPAAGDDMDATMRRHRWAVERLWEGIVTDSESLWSAGATAFRDIPACNDDLGGERDAAALEVLRARALELPDAAVAAEDLEARAVIYGQLLATCGSCHLAGC